MSFDMRCLRLAHTPVRASHLAAAFALALVLLLTTSGCPQGTPADVPSVVVYTSVDPEYARAIADAFTKATGIAVVLKTDSELQKTVGFRDLLRAEREHPRADVFWNSEIALTVTLAREGLLAPYASPEAKGSVPAGDAANRFQIAGKRLRLLVVPAGNEAPGAPPATPAGPRALATLAAPANAATLALADPRFGTTATQAAALWQAWGAERARAFYAKLAAGGCLPAGGNAQVVDLVARGAKRLGITDSDDAWAAQAEGKAVRVLPLVPLLWIPGTIGLVSGAPHAESARRFIDFVCSAPGQRAMVATRARFWPSRTDVAAPPLPAALDKLAELPVLQVDWSAIGPDYARARAALDELFYENR